MSRRTMALSSASSTVIRFMVGVMAETLVINGCVKLCIGCPAPAMG